MCFFPTTAIKEPYNAPDNAPINPPNIAPNTIRTKLHKLNGFLRSNPFLDFFGFIVLLGNELDYINIP